MSGVLYLIPTPIGNLKEVSPRVMEVLSSVDYVACEDTRNTAKLLSLIGISKSCFSCHEHNEVEASNKIINDILEGKNVGYASDAGYPCISDPGSILVSKCIEKDITVVPLSGPNAFLNALVGSGLNTSHFYFYGFLNAKESLREKELESIKDFNETILFYEAPHRINDTLKSMYKVLGNRKICVARELTKIYEEFIRTDLEDLVNNKREFKGELVLVVEGAPKSENSEDAYENSLNEVQKLVDAGLSSKDAILAVSTLYKLNKNKLYKLFLSSK